MSYYPSQQMFRPVEANIDLSGLQFSDYSNHGLQVADYSKVEYLQPSDSEEEEEEFDEMDYTYGDGKSRPSVSQLIHELGCRHCIFC